MAYADLTADHQNSLDAWMALFRPTCGEFARLNNHHEAINTEYTGTTTAILNLLLDEDEIPNKSGLAGAEPMTKAQIVTVVSYMQAILAYNTTAHRANLARAAGEANLIG